MGRMMGLVGQVGVAVLALVLAALWPPAQGAMMVVPLTPMSQARLANVAIGHGGRLFGAGALPGSIVVEGSRVTLAPAYRRLGAILVAATPPVCDAAARARS